MNVSFLTKPQNRRGFTLTELAIVLGIMGTILGAIWGAAARVTANNKAQKAQGQVLQILAGYRNLFAQRRVDTGAGKLIDITAMGINSGIFPSDMVSGGVVYNPWGTTVTVKGDQDNNGILISYWTLPQSACIALASSEANAPDLINSYVGNTGAAFPNAIAYPAAAMSSTTISDDCSKSATDNEVTFEYKAQ